MCLLLIFKQKMFTEAQKKVDCGIVIVGKY